MKNAVWIRVTFFTGLGSYAFGIMMSAFSTGRPAWLMMLGTAFLWVSLMHASATEDEHETPLSRYYDMNWPLWVLIVVLLGLTAWPVVDWLFSPPLIIWE